MRLSTPTATDGIHYDWDCSSAASRSFFFLLTPIFDIMTNVERCLLSAAAQLGTLCGSLSSVGERSSQHWADRNLPCQRLLVTRTGALHFLLFAAPQAQSVLVYSSSQAWCHASGMGQWRRSKRPRGRFSSPEEQGVYLAYLWLKFNAWWPQHVSLCLLGSTLALQALFATEPTASQLCFTAIWELTGCVIALTFSW